MIRYFTLILFIGLAWGQSKMDINNLIDRVGVLYAPNKEKPFSGSVFDLYDNGQKKLNGRYRNGIKNGKWTWWNENGGIDSTGSYNNGLMNGIWQFYDSNGNLKAKVSLKNGEKDGKWTFWYEDGQKREEGTFKDGEIISSKCWDEDGNECECSENWCECCKSFPKSYKMSTTGMENTLMFDEVYKFVPLKHEKNIKNSIVVFKYPRDRKVDYCKRVIAGYGDTIKIIDKKVFINNFEQPLPKSGKYLTAPMQKKFMQPDIFLHSEININRDNMGPIYVPKKGDVFSINSETNWRFLLPIILMEGHTATLDNNEVNYEFTLQDPNELFRRKGKQNVYNVYFPNGKLLTPWSKAIKDEHFQFLMIDGKPLNEWTEYTATQNYYWAMGDNRDDSLDSRYWGFIPWSYMQYELILE